jgi:hypothetical protein
MTHAAISPEEVQRCKRLLLKKGSEINEKLTRLLNNQQVSIEGLMGGGKPGETPIERLRRFMKLIDDNLKRIRDGSYGKCVTCGDALPFAHLEQVPWIDTCQKCAAIDPGA